MSERPLSRRPATTAGVHLRPELPKALRVLLIVSAVLHLLVIVGVALMGMVRPALSASPMTFIPTKLVKLGKKRPENLLPTVNRQPPPAAKPKVNLAKPQTPAAPKTEAKPQPALASALERAKELSTVSNALDRLKSTSKAQAEDEGDPQGVEGGEVSDLTKAIMGNKIATEIHHCINSNYAIEGTDRAQAAGKSASLLVRVQPDGKLFGTKILAASGFGPLDRAVENAVTRCGKISAPPPELRDILREEGVEIVFRP